MGIKVWRDASCVDFIEDKDAVDKVVVVKEDGCWSSNGRVGGDQFLSLGEECDTEGTAVHEIGHVLGLIHTMSRYDRDHFIRVAVKNLAPAHIRDFAKVMWRYVDAYGFMYDFGSVMHYGELSYSINQQPTIVAKDPHYQKTMGSEIISFTDISIINQRYGCNAKCNESTSAQCANDGFPHPRNCSICICPGGYGGALCDVRPPGCGEDLLATSEKQTVGYKLGTGSDLKNQFDFCNYMITVKAPEGKKIELSLLSISSGYDEGGCPRGGVEIKAQEDHRVTGYRFCSMNGSDEPIVSSYNRLPVIIFNRLGTMEGNFTFRYIE